MPELINIKEVHVIAEVGTSVGIVSLEDGKLTLVVRGPGVSEWPHGVCHATGVNTIQVGYTRWIVFGDVQVAAEVVTGGT